jgi:hypothetical protein
LVGVTVSVALLALSLLSAVEAVGAACEAPPKRRKSPAARIKANRPLVLII